MLRENVNLGGEQSGHYCILDYNTTGDGLISALQLLKIIIRLNKPLSEIKKSIQAFTTKHIEISKYTQKYP